MDSHEENARLKGKRVLIAEDNRMNALVAQKFLQQAQAQTDWVKNGAQAVEMAEAQRYDLILMDIQMPEMDGYEATERIRATYGASLPILALTASPSLDPDTEIYARRFDGYLVKPFDAQELTAAIAEALGKA